MKHISCIILLLFSITTSFCQIKAITSNGEEVILRTDGTWSYVNDSAESNVKIDTSLINFEKKSSASFLVKSSKVNCGVYIDPKKWVFTKSKGDDASEIGFTLKDKDAYAMLITEKIEMPFETLKSAALSNAREVAPDIKVIREEYRNVNGKIVMMIQMAGSLRGIKFTYVGYYFSSAKGTVQLITYTSTNLLDEYYKDLEDFLNGFVVTES